MRKLRQRREADLANAAIPEKASGIPPLDPQPDEKFIAQEKKMKQGTTVESKYLKERIWGFWYIILPLFIVVSIFIYWVYKKH